MKNRGLITEISDDRLKLIANSLYAWVLRFAGLFDCPFVRNEDENNLAIEFSNVYNLAKSQYFNNSQEKAFKKTLAEIAVTVLKNADVVCTTPVQVGNKIFDELTFDGVIVDEAGVVTESELCVAWRGTDAVLLLGDLFQQGPVTKSSPRDNPFVQCLSQPVFDRMLRVGIPMHPLQESQRSKSKPLSKAVSCDCHYVVIAKSEIDKG